MPLLPPSRIRRPLTTVAAASFAVLAVTVLTVRAGGGEVAAAPGLAVYDACKPVDAIWVRGSGQVVSQSVSAENWTNQYRRFRSELERRLGDETVHFYELGFEPITGYQYPAEAVGTGDWDAISSSLGALFSGGQSYEYGASVDQGVGELSMYVKLRLITCPDTLFVVGGYSQGAQVAGEAYVEELTPLERSAVVFTMLFGDPKLYLPEGSVDWADWHDDEHSNTPPACQGRGLSEWRRGVPNCRTNAGSLGSRVPYLPASWSDTTGLWCADRDFICGSASAPWTLDGHMAYSQSGAIDEGVREAVERLQARMPGSTFNTKWLTVKQGAVGLDVVFVVDSTGSMTSRIAAARALASTLAGDVVGRSGRVALVEYRDAGDRFTARVLTQLAADDSDFTRALNGIRVGGGGDAPEALLHALKTAMEGVDWTPGATKAIVVLTDAGFHSPDRVDGTTLAQVAALSLSIDPVNVYPVVPASLASAYAELAEATTGQVVADTGDTAEALLEALTRVIDRPVARLPLNTYEAAPGDEVFFDGSSSYSVDSEIAAWDWDFDGDGVYEVTDGGSTASYVYEDRFDGFMQMRVWDAAGLVASTSVRVLVGADAVASEDEPRDLTAEVDGYTATVSWTTAQDPPSAWRVTLNGVELGYAPPEARSVGLTDLAWDGPNLVGITPLYAEVGLGETALIDLTESRPDPGPAQSGTPPNESGPTASAGATGSTPSGAPSPSAGSTETVSSDEPLEAEPSISLSAGSVGPGGDLTVTGAGFTPGAEFGVWLRSDPAALARGQVSADGTFSVSVVIPISTEPGKQSVVASAGGAQATAELSVRTEPARSVLPLTGSMASPWLAAAGVALALGAVMAFARRGRESADGRARGR